MPNRVEDLIGERSLIIETGKLALQANGAVTVRYGDTVVLVTACASKQPLAKADFLPLTVDYEERLYAAGKIPGGFFRREGRPGQEATLAARLTDRPLRPLFPQGFRHEVQIVATVLSADQENSPEVLAIIGSSAALILSDIPFEGPVAAVRIGYIGDKFVVNPTFSQLQDSVLDLVVAGTKEAVVMVEAGAKEAPEDIVIGAIKLGHEVNRRIIVLQERLQNTCGKPKMEFKPAPANPELEANVTSLVAGRLSEITLVADKSQREVALSALEKELVEKLSERYPSGEVLFVLESQVKAEVRRNILERGLRPGGRGLTEIRPISSEVGLLPRTHGSALFCRGQTQVLTIATLGSSGEEQMLDGLTREESKRFMHHYNFPPFSTGETKRIGAPSRREIGHGALVERALAPMIPAETEFPYTIRLVSEVIGSNGSTSMASVCGSTLSLMDAGVPIKGVVAGIAMGLVSGNGKHAVLTDIEGWEDAYGDMDFKVAGTAKGATALQLDIKTKGVNYEVLQQAIAQARDARLTILGKMEQTLATSRPELSRHAPRIIKITINSNKIGSVIGPGGKTIRRIIEETKTTIDIENDGTVLIGSTTEEGSQKAIKMIEDLTREVEIGNTYVGKVTRLLPFGAMVEIFPGKEGLVHISELADYKVSSVEDVVKVGDEIMVVATGIDHQGRLNLSRKAVFQGSGETGTRGRDSAGSRETSPGARRPASAPSSFQRHGSRDSSFGEHKPGGSEPKG